MNAFSEFLVSALVVLGALFVLLGSVGLARLPDFLMRLHAPTKATTLGVGALLLASALVLELTNEDRITEMSLFAATLAIQSLPFLAASAMMLIERFQKSQVCGAAEPATVFGLESAADSMEPSR